MEALDNPVWAALTTHHRGFAQGTGRARRYAPEVGAFWAVDGLDEAGWRALEALAGPGGLAVLFRPGVGAVDPAGAEVFRMTADQLVLDGAPAAAPPWPHGLRPELLGPADVVDMLALTELAKPGPFFARTRELGDYWGVRGPDGRLVAMAGERMRLAGATEISAVSTHPDHRRQGLGAAITAWVAERVQARGDLPFLHVATDNSAARGVYEGLGFRRRTVVDIVGWRPHDRPAPGPS